MQSPIHNQVVGFGGEAGRAPRAARRPLSPWRCLVMVAAGLVVMWLPSTWQGDVRPSIWSAAWDAAGDGRTVVFTSPDGRPRAMYALDLKTKQVRRLELPGEPLAEPRISPDGTCVAMATCDADGAVGVWLQPLHGGQGGSWRCLSDSRWVRSYDWSADGATLYVADVPRGTRHRHGCPSRVLVVNVATGGERVLAESNEDPVDLRVNRGGDHDGHVLYHGVAEGWRHHERVAVFCVDPDRDARHALPSVPCTSDRVACGGTRRLAWTVARGGPMMWRILDAEDHTVVGPFPTSDDDWGRAKLMPDGQTVLRERWSDHAVELLHSDGTAEPMFDRRLIGDPLRWTPQPLSH